MWGRCAEICGDVGRRCCSGTWGDMGEIWGDVGTCSVTERSSRVSATTALLRALPFCRPSALLIFFMEPLRPAPSDLRSLPERELEPEELLRRGKLGPRSASGAPWLGLGLGLGLGQGLG